MTKKVRLKMSPNALLFCETVLSARQWKKSKLFFSALHNWSEEAAEIEVFESLGGQGEVTYGGRFDTLSPILERAERLVCSFEDGSHFRDPEWGETAVSFRNERISDEVSGLLAKIKEKAPHHSMPLLLGALFYDYLYLSLGELPLEQVHGIREQFEEDLAIFNNF